MTYTRATRTSDRFFVCGPFLARAHSLALIGAMLAGSTFATACSGDDDSGIMSTQVPPSDSAMFQAWLASEEYKAWSCDPEPTPETGVSPHGMKQICRNDVVVNANDGTGNWPVGATLVKEQLDGNGNVGAISMETRVNAMDGKDAWHYFRVEGSSITHDGVGLDFCSGCHSGASRDFVFVP